MRAIFATLAVLIIGYPCALGMATPLAMIRGGGLAAERGILMRSGEAFQIFPEIKKVILDKTGTITKGEPKVKKIISFSDTTEEKVLHFAVATENLSEHPLARAIVDEANQRNIKISKAYNFRSYPGQGVKAQVDGSEVIVGKPGFLKANGIALESAKALIEDLEKMGSTKL